MECFVKPIFLVTSLAVAEAAGSQGAVTMMPSSPDLPIHLLSEHEVIAKLVVPAAALEDELNVEGVAEPAVTAKLVVLAAALEDEANVEGVAEHAVTAKLVVPAGEFNGEPETEGVANLAAWRNSEEPAPSPLAGCEAGDLKNSADGEATTKPRAAAGVGNSAGGRSIEIGSEVDNEADWVEAGVGDVGVIVRVRGRGVVEDGAVILVMGRGTGPTSDHGEGTWKGLDISARHELSPCRMNTAAQAIIKTANAENDSTFRSTPVSNIPKYAERAEIQCYHAHHGTKMKIALWGHE